MILFIAPIKSQEENSLCENDVTVQEKEISNEEIKYDEVIDKETESNIDTENKDILQISDTSASETDVYTENESELNSDDVYNMPKGTWHFTDSKLLIHNLDDRTKWKGYAGDVEAEMQRIDPYDIEHTITSHFKWEPPAVILTPGTETSIYASYTDKDYSSTSPTPTGIITKIEESSKNFYNYIEIIKQGKSLYHPNSEDLDGKFLVPVYNGKDHLMQITVHCFIGNDHYLVSYMYEWEK